MTTKTTKTKEKTTKKYYCVYLAWNKREILSPIDEGFDELPDYPKVLARVRVYDNPTDQLMAYSNIPCPASQLFEASSEKEINEKIEEFGRNFENEEWLKKNIHPYV